MSPFQDQQSFMNYFQNELGITRSEKFLQKLEQVVPWEHIGKQIKSQRKENIN